MDSTITRDIMKCFPRRKIRSSVVKRWTSCQICKYLCVWFGAYQTRWRGRWWRWRHQEILQVLLLLLTQAILEACGNAPSSWMYLWSKGSFHVHWRCLQDPTHIFQLLGDEGFTIPQHLKYFSLRATFDFECMFNPKTTLNDTEKLTWNTKHIPLSVSVCCNIPEYDKPKYFVSDGDSKQFIKDMLQYLVKISQESCRLMKEFSFIFEAIDQKLEELKQTPDRTQRVLVPSLMKIATAREKISRRSTMKKKNGIWDRGGLCFPGQWIEWRTRAFILQSARSRTWESEWRWRVCGW